MGRGAKVALSFLGGLLALGVAGILWFVAVMSGGFDNLLDIDHPKQTDSDVRKARTEAVAKANSDTAALVAELEAATGLRHSARLESHADFCDEGQHNWKTDTDYDLLCTVERKVLLLGDGAQAATQLAALTSWLDGNGYRSTYGQGMSLRSDPGDTLQDSELVSSNRYLAAERTVELQLLAHDSPPYRLRTLGDPRRMLLVDGTPADDRLLPAHLVGPTHYAVLVTLSLESFRD